MFFISFTSGNLNKILSRVFTTGILAVISIFSGLVPEVSPQFPQLSLVSYAYAQDYTQDEVVNYAKAGFQVEMLRQQVYKEIKSIINQPLPDIVCNQPATLQNLSSNVKEIATRYCENSRQIVQKNNLTINRFNELKQVYDRGGTFYQQVQNALIELQNR